MLTTLALSLAVLDSSSAPNSGAELRVVRAPDSEAVGGATVLIADPRSQSVHELATDREGCVLPPIQRPFAVLVEAGGHRSRALWVAEEHDTPIEVLPTTTLRVAVCNETGDPVEGVELAVRWPADRNLGREAAPRRGRTATVAPTGSEREALERADADRRSTLRAVFTNGTPGSPLAERLEAALPFLNPVVRGTVGRGASKRAVCPWSMQDPDGPPGARITDERGRAEWADLPIGFGFMLELRSEHAAAEPGGGASALGPIDLTLDRAREWQLTLADQQLVVGRVRGADGPVEVVITAAARDRRGVRSGASVQRSFTTEEDGRFLALGLPLGSHRLTARWSSLDESTDTEDIWFVQHEFELRSGLPVDLGDLAVAVGSIELRATLRNEQGELLQAADVLPPGEASPSYQLNPVAPSVLEARTVELPFGRTVRVHGVGPRSYVLTSMREVERSADGRRIHRTAGYQCSGDGGPVELVHTVLDRHALELVLVRPEGREFPLEVHFLADYRMPTLAIEGATFSSASSSDFVHHQLAVTAQSSTARSVLDSGKYHVRICSTDPESSFFCRATIDLWEDEAREFTLEPAVTLRGHWQNKLPPPRWREVLLHEKGVGGIARRAPIGEDGTFVVPGLVPFTNYLLSIHGRSVEVVTGAPGTTTEWSGPADR